MASAKAKDQWKRLQAATERKLTFGDLEVQGHALLAQDGSTLLALTLHIGREYHLAVFDQRGALVRIAHGSGSNQVWDQIVAELVGMGLALPGE